MSYTVADLQALQSLKATGASKIKYSDGREVWIRDPEQLRQIEAEIMLALGMGGAPRTYVATVRR